MLVVLSINKTFSISDQDDRKKPFRVLSIDGGGIRGLYTALLLHHLSVRFSGDGSFGKEVNHGSFDLGKKFDLIVGTSTGAILAVSLAAGIPLGKVIELYKNKGKDVFQNPSPLKNESHFITKLLVWYFGKMFKSANDPCQLQKYLGEILHDETLGQLYERRKIALCIPAINAETRRSWVFKTPHSSRLTRDANYGLVDVCLASSAAPVFFPLHAVRNHSETSDVHKFTDGGLWANNPSLVGLVEALELSGERPIEILSAGTLNIPQSHVIADKSCDWGVYKWGGGVEIVKMSMEAQACSISYYVSQVCARLNRVTYYRLNDPEISSENAPFLEMDAVGDESIQVLVKLAMQSIDDNHSDLTSPTSLKVDSRVKEMVCDMFSNLEIIRGDSI